MTKIGNEQVKPISRQANIPPAIDRSLQGAAGSQASMEEKPKEEGSVLTTSQPAQPVGKTQPSGNRQPAGNIQPAVATLPTSDNKKDLIGYDTQINILKSAREAYAKANETEEERKKREKREKSKRIIAAVGDGIRALSNLYFTSQYAPNMYNPNDSQLAKEDARQEKLKAEREANRDKYLNYSLRIGNLENERANALREMEEKAERLRLARERGDREREAHQWLAGRQADINREQAAKANAADSVAKVRKAEADNADAIQQAKLNTEIEKGNTEKSRQENLRAGAEEKRVGAALKRSGIAVNDARVGAINRSKGSSSSGKAYGTFNGKVYATKSDYDKAVVAYAKENKIPLQYVATSGKYGKNKKTINRTITGLAAEGELHYKKSQKNSKKKVSGSKNNNWASGLHF